MSMSYRYGESLIADIRNTVVPANAVAIWNIGQAGVILKGDSVQGKKERPIIAIDPYLTRAIETDHPGTEFVREYDAPLVPEDLVGIAMVLITHHHDDHLDLSTIRPLHNVSPSTRFVVPAPHVGMLRDAGIPDDAIILARAGQAIYTDDVEILPVAAAHTDYETDAAGDHLYLGYVVNVNGIRIYHSGDTIVTGELVRTMKSVKPHIAMLPINGGDYARSQRGIVSNMTAREAVDFAVEIGADMLLPNHYDMFPNNRDNPAHFVDYLFHHHRNLKFHMSAVGERFIYLV